MQPRFCYNKRAQETLAAFVNGGRFPHALLLEGPEGSGRRTFAREIAAALFCRGEHKPCGSCNQCRKVLEQNHPDVEYYGGDGSRRSFHIDTIRQLRQNAWLLPGEAPCRVCVLCGAENMTDQAQNALLKILEEPPEHTVFILTAENRAMLLPTILSRVQTIRLEPLTPAEILPVLRERCPDQPGEKLEWAAETADTIGQALALLADESLQKHAQLAQRMLELLCNGSEYDLLTAVEPVSRKREDLLEVCTQLRQLLTAELTRAASGGESRFSTRRITRMLEALDDLLPRVQQNGNTLLLSTLLALRLSQA
ncbi:MAG: hypothetical protein V8R84_05285 [Eubacterium sp.]